ncbi:MAG: asparagine synthase (glutamine-hydrolyzing) [Terrimicrobiaceae bacterium]
MCGIAGFVGHGSSEDLRRMTRKLTHRGPDAEGYLEAPSQGVYLGHRRLSILDLDGGAQPMSTADKTLHIVFNGEIYNHPELRQALEAAGCVFETDHSDTEVLLHGYRVWGEGLVGRLNGMWAFVIWDSAKNRIFASRDRFGKKPFYWFFRNGILGFASELKALLEHPAAPRSLSASARRKLFAYALVPAPHSMIDGISKLPGGCHLTMEPGHEPRIHRYWTFQIAPEERGLSDDELASELRELLDRAVRRRLVADVPLGIFLSGGIDSSAVAALAARHAGTEKLKTFSVGFKEATFDESVYAARVAKMLGTAHQCEILDLPAARNLLPALLASVDEPQGDNSLLPTWLLCGFTRKHVTVALGGDGGDELFAGYDTFRGLGMAETYARLVPGPIHEGIRALIARIPVSHNNLSLDFKLKRGMRGASHPPRVWNPVWLGALEADEIADFLGGPADMEDLYSEAILAWEDCESRNLIDRTLEFYTKIYLQDGILAKVDRASMLQSLEARSPFLDIEVADFARKLPHRFKLRNGTTKFLLKKALRGLLPDDIIDRKKKGFGSPVGAWFKEGLLTPKSRDPFVQSRVTSHREGRSDERLFLWCQLALEAWEESLFSTSANQ